MKKLTMPAPSLALRASWSTTDWKLLFNPDGSRVELYDLPRQPMELHSQAAAHPELVKRLTDLALRWQETLPVGPRTEHPGSLQYPGYHEGPGRGPLKNPAHYEKLTAPVRVRLMRDWPQQNSAVLDRMSDSWSDDLKN